GVRGAGEGEWDGGGGGGGGGAVLAGREPDPPAAPPQPTPRAEEARVAQPGRARPAARLPPLRHVTEQELPAGKPALLQVSRVGPPAQDDGHLDREEHAPTQVAVERVEPAGRVLQQDRRRARLAAAGTLPAEVVPLLRESLRL